MKAKEHHIEIEIDKLTRSIENLITGDSFPTEVTILENADLQLIIKKHGWRFDWNKVPPSISENKKYILGFLEI
jgi:hypothetical protein